jgi:hypothetical protein
MKTTTGCLAPGFIPPKSDFYGRPGTGLSVTASMFGMRVTGDPWLDSTGELTTASDIRAWGFVEGTGEIENSSTTPA